MPPLRRLMQFVALLAAVALLPGDVQLDGALTHVVREEGVAARPDDLHDPRRAVPTGSAADEGVARLRVARPTAADAVEAPDQSSRGQVKPRQVQRRRSGVVRILDVARAPKAADRSRRPDARAAARRAKAKAAPPAKARAAKTRAAKARTVTARRATAHTARKAAAAKGRTAAAKSRRATAAKTRKPAPAQVRKATPRGQRKAAAARPQRRRRIPAPKIRQVPVVEVRGIVVARRIAGNTERLLRAADRAGVRLGGWGYRSTQRQIQLRRAHCGRSRYALYRMPSSRCGPPTARPGKSMHERGLAIDFYRVGPKGRPRPIKGTAEFRWLRRHAHRFGFYNFPPEPWHWSTNGR